MNYNTNSGLHVTDGYVASGDWINQENYNTGAGLVSGTMIGTAFLVWGGPCIIGNPTPGDAEYIS